MSAAAPTSHGHTLRLEDVCIRLDGALLVNLNAEIAPGEVLTIMGPSGSGKSTLLGYLAGFISGAFKAKGRILLDGVDVADQAPEDRGVGLLFQDSLLFPHLSVRGNLLFGLTARPEDSRAKRRARVDVALGKAGLAGFGARDIGTLSGGQQSRVALLRVLLSEPRAMLMDEPFSRLDTALRQEFRAYVFANLRQRGLPALLVTHDRADAEAAGGPVLRL